jgi:hypothetical protein
MPPFRPCGTPCQLPTLPRRQWEELPTPLSRHPTAG